MHQHDVAFGIRIAQDFLVHVVEVIGADLLHAHDVDVEVRRLGEIADADADGGQQRILLRRRQRQQGRSGARRCGFRRLRCLAAAGGKRQRTSSDAAITVFMSLSHQVFCLV